MTSTKTTLFALTTLLLSSSAFAADVFSGDKSLKDDANYAAGGTVNWTGFYIGGSLGYGNANHDLSVQRYNGSYCYDDVGQQASVPPLDPTDPSAVFGSAFAVDPVPASGLCTDARIPTMNDPNGSSDAALVGPSSRETATLDGVNSAGLVGDGRVGFDFARGRFLFGVFGSYGFSNMEANASGSGTGDISNPDVSLELTNIEKTEEWSVGARAGLIVAPRTLAYILAAYTQASYDFNGNLTDAAGTRGFSRETTFDGVTVGGGVEFALTQNIFLGIEGTHTFYGKETVLDTGSSALGGFGEKIEDDLDETKVMGTLKIKLNTGLGGF
jgi:opacity protein-like surface antigen